MARIRKGSADQVQTSRRVSFRHTRRALEPRVLLDAAAVETLVDVTSGPAILAESGDDTSQLVDALSSLEGGVTEAVFVDGALDDAEQLAASLEQPGRLVVLLGSGDGLDQINSALAGHSNLSAIHIVSHGSDGVIQLGDTALDSALASTREADLAALGSVLAEDGDLRIYGCDVAQSAGGESFVDQLASLTGADVAASDDVTGQTGDWQLEYQKGEIESDTPEVLASYLGDLNLEGASAGIETGPSAGYNLGEYTDASGDWVVSSGGSGEARVYRVLGNTRDIVQVLDPGGSSATFGTGVAIYGTEMVIGDLTNNRVYIYQLDSNDVWQLRANPTLSGVTSSTWGAWNDGAWSSNQFIDIDSGRILVGAPQENDGGGAGEGRVSWLLDTSVDGDWSSISTGNFDEPGFAEGDSSAAFGASVSIAGDYFVVGAPGADNDDDAWGSSGNHGAAIVYSWSRASADAGSGPSSTVLTRLVGQNDVDGVNGGQGVGGARFGSALDMELYDGKYTIVAGAPGEGNLDDDSGWNENGYDGQGGEIYIYQTINSTINDGASFNGASNIYGQTEDGSDSGSMRDPDRFGAYVRVSQSRILVGAKTPHPENGKAIVWYYESINNTWTGLDTNNPGGLDYINTFNFSASELGVAGVDYPGRSLAFVGGSLAVIGAYNDDNNNLTDSGSLVFRAMRTPFAANDNYSISEDATNASYDIIDNDVFGSESLASVDFELVAGSQVGFGTFNWNGATLEYNPGSSYQYLAVGETATVTITYKLTDQTPMGTTGGTTYYYSSLATVTFTINGANDAVGDGIGLDDVDVPQSNDPVNASTPQAPSTGTLLIRDNVFSDIDTSDDLTYSLVGVTQITGAASSNPSITVNGNTGFRTGSIDYDLTGVTEYTQFQVTIRANDGNGSTRDTTFILTVARTNETPELTGAIPDDNATEDSLYSNDLGGYFTDPDYSWVDPDSGDSLDFTENLTFSITSQTGPGADWLAISRDGVISGVPTNDNALSGGVHTVTVRATDIFGNYVEDTFTVTVANTNDAPVLIKDIDRVTAESGTGAAVFNFNVTAANTDNPDGPFFEDIDPTGDTITYTAELLDGTPITTTDAGSGTGSWIRFDGTSFTGTPTEPLGTIFTVRLIATDDHGAFTGTLFEVGVFPPTGDSDVTNDDGATAGDRLGFSSAISGNGLWAVHGQPGENSGNGAVKVFENVGGTWTHRQTINTGMVAGSRFGVSVDLNDAGDRLVVGAPMENGQRGAIYYFTRAGTTFSASGNVKAVGTQAGERLGMSVAINEAGNNVLAGAPLNDNAQGTNAGAAYWFGFDATAASVTRLPTSDGGSDSAAGDLFGMSVGFDQNMQVVGATRDDHSGARDAGSVYVFSTDNSSSTKLIRNGTPRDADYFGASISVDSFNGRDGVILAVGAAGDDSAASGAGAAYIFRSSTMVADSGNNDGALDSLVYHSTILAYDVQAFQGFGGSVAVDVSGDVEANGIRVAVGSDMNASSTGAVYGFRYWDGYGWVGQRYEPASVLDGSSYEGNQYGMSLDLAGTTVVAGAPSADRSGQFAAGLVYTVTLSSSEIEISPLSDTLVKTLAVPGIADDNGEADELERSKLLSGDEMQLGDAMSFDMEPESINHQSADSGISAAGRQGIDGLLLELLTLNPLAELSEGEPCDEDEACAEEVESDAPAANDGEQARFPDQLKSAAEGKTVESARLLDRLAKLSA